MSAAMKTAIAAGGDGSPAKSMRTPKLVVGVAPQAVYYVGGGCECEERHLHKYSPELDLVRQTAELDHPLDEQARKCVHERGSMSYIDVARRTGVLAGDDGSVFGYTEDQAEHEERSGRPNGKLVG